MNFKNYYIAFFNKDFKEESIEIQTRIFNHERRTRIKRRPS